MTPIGYDGQSPKFYGDPDMDYIDKEAVAVIKSIRDRIKESMKSNVGIPIIYGTAGDIKNHQGFKEMWAGATML